MSDAYVVQTTARYLPTVTDPVSLMGALWPYLQAWANGHSYELKLSGSHAKGTGIAGSTDVDVFISLAPTVSEYNTLEQVYHSLSNQLTSRGYAVRQQNVSLAIEHAGLKIDFVPGVRHHALSNDHSLWKRKEGTWTKTNIDVQIQRVIDSGRASDIRALKIWRNCQRLEFPSFCLELAAIEALKGKSHSGSAAEHFVAMLTYLRDTFRYATLIDPSNTNNKVSDELSDTEKGVIAVAAKRSLSSSWSEVIW